MADSAGRKATYQDVLDAPRDKVAEVIEGRLHVQPRPGMPHAVAASVLGAELGSAFGRGRGGPGGWILLDEPELHLREDIVVPDLAGWRRERMSVVPADPFVTMAPDWLCEVLSPSTAKLDRADKLRVYAREGVPHVWLLDPLQHTLEVLRLEGEHYSLRGVHKDDDVVQAEPFEVYDLDLAVL
jgi:Uma2 family endonuclease